MSTCTVSSSFVASPEGVRFLFHVLTCLEVPIHIFGAYCILFKTPLQMSSVKWLLLNLHFWSALEDVFVSVLVVPYTLLPAIAYWPLGLWNEPRYEAYLVVTFMIAVGMATLLIFENRYNVVVAEPESSSWCHVRKPMLVTNFVLIWFYFLPPILDYQSQDEARSVVLESLPCLSEIQVTGRGPFYVVTNKHLLAVACTGVPFVLVVSQAVIFLLLTVWKLFFRTSQTISKQTQKLQKQLAKALIAQAVIPLAVIVFPVSTLLVVVTFGIYNQALNNLMFLILTAHGLMSAVLMIFVHRPYRHFTLSPLFWTRQQLKKYSNVVHLRTHLVQNQYQAR